MIPRPRLYRALEKGIHRFKLTLVSAPVGYGKTTLLAGWARGSGLPVAWLSVDSELDGVERFMRYLLAAWEKVQPDIASTTLATLLDSQVPEINRVLVAFVNAGYRSPDSLVFVVDDYDLIEDPEIHDALAYILDNL
ncbi:MAG: LuxR C-terminal-related transcriptional regulator, partial [Anaerolineales bacterium]